MWITTIVRELASGEAENAAAGSAHASASLCSGAQKENGRRHCLCSVRQGRSRAGFLLPDCRGCGGDMLSDSCSQMC